LSDTDVRRLAEESGHHRALVFTLAYCGLRWGEAIGLRVRDVEFLRRRLSVHENAVQIGSHYAVCPTRGRQARSVPVPQSVRGELSRQCAGKAAGDLLFPSRNGSYLGRPDSATGWFVVAVKRAGVQIHYSA
jgi:integrase